MSDPVMVPRYNIPLHEERDVALARLQRICDNGFISVLDFRTNPLRIFAAHELAAIIDPAMTTKMTVQVHDFLIYISENSFSIVLLVLFFFPQINFLANNLYISI